MLALLKDRPLLISVSAFAAWVMASSAIDSYERYRWIWEQSVTPAQHYVYGWFMGLAIFASVLAFGGVVAYRIWKVGDEHDWWF